jgi:hypothetical protein
MPVRSNDLNQSQALRRVRAGGAVVPQKVIHSPTTANSLSPIFGPTYNKPLPIRTTHHSFLRNMFSWR